MREMNTVLLAGCYDHCKAAALVVLFANQVSNKANTMELSYSVHYKGLYNATYGSAEIQSDSTHNSI